MPGADVVRHTIQTGPHGEHGSTPPGNPSVETRNVRPDLATNGRSTSRRRGRCGLRRPGHQHAQPVGGLVGVPAGGRVGLALGGECGGRAGARGGRAARPAAASAVFSIDSSENAPNSPEASTRSSRRPRRVAAATPDLQEHPFLREGDQRQCSGRTAARRGRRPSQHTGGNGLLHAGETPRVAPRRPRAPAPPRRPRRGDARTVALASALPSRRAASFRATRAARPIAEQRKDGRRRQPEGRRGGAGPRRGAGRLAGGELGGLVARNGRHGAWPRSAAAQGGGQRGGGSATPGIDMVRSRIRT